jgi:RNA polymerase sigma-70 factor (ECF subfamily)
MASEFHTTKLHQWIAGLRQNDPLAQDKLFRAVGDRLEHLAHKMLRHFPRVRRWADTGDVMQNASLRLLRALTEVQPSSTSEFFGLSAELIRRELLDLARKFYNSKGMGNQKSIPPPAGTSAADHDPPDPERDWDLEKWCAFHNEVARLPTEEKEVVSLVYYHGWTQAQVAELFQVTERTVRRRWQAAMLKLHHLLNNQHQS